MLRSHAFDTQSFHRASSGRRPRVVTRSVSIGPNGNGVAIPDGAKVKVTKPVKIYHVPKVPELNLEGLEGEVQRNVTQYKGKVLSANLPYQVKFKTQVNDKEISFMAHLSDDEVQVL